MRRNQLLLIGLAVAVVTVLYAFGRITPKVHDHAHAPAGVMPEGQAAVADFKDLLQKAKEKVPAEKLAEITSLENTVVRGDVKSQQITAYMQLYTIWDNLNELPVAAYYLAEAAKLENSGKSLTFAANLFLDHLSHTQDAGVRMWEANNAMELLDKAIALQPNNDTLKIKLGSLLVSNTNEPMKGIAMLRDVAERKPDFLDAQLALANFSITSGQFDKAIERMEEVLKRHPDEPKALFLLAVAYQNKGEKDKAVELLRQCRKLIKDPSLAAEIDEYIKSIQ
ncbi:tetratricopeptide repeat protein [Chitinophaga sp. XS-30]|uniref:tetratricopeptide repeat protein n=1 Tax=Chitinophaga sp. XS-30 TaxID=2604421 RepID=UPI0011DD9317|nr:tetratricopeptide repeat protein [Chitinophaga sp. XS-30]QEH40291.1 tetratricopeptide repeat protein [Chitinophaga sp. XS-30]